MVHPPLYPNPFPEIVTGEEMVVTVDCLEARGESNGEEEVIPDVVGGGEVGVRSGAELEGFNFVDALRCANLIPPSDRGTVLDTSGMPICKYPLYDDL